MSFILDALKKAESERNRASGPVLVDVRIAPPRRQLPAWAWVLGAVLLANLGVLAWLMFYRPAAPAAAAAQAPAELPVAAPPPASTAVAAAPAPAQAEPAVVDLQALPASTYPQPGSPAIGTSAAPPASRQPVDPGQLPTARALQSAGVSLPPLLMNLHVYDPTPALRYVLLNGLRLTEGEFTPDGIKVETIVEGGVVLEARGQRFLLPAGG